MKVNLINNIINTNNVINVDFTFNTANHCKKIASEKHYAEKRKKYFSLGNLTLTQIKYTLINNRINITNLTNINFAFTS